MTGATEGRGNKRKGVYRWTFDVAILSTVTIRKVPTRPYQVYWMEFWSMGPDRLQRAPAHRNFAVKKLRAFFHNMYAYIMDLRRKNMRSIPRANKHKNPRGRCITAATDKNDPPISRLQGKKARFRWCVTIKKLAEGGGSTTFRSDIHRPPPGRTFAPRVGRAGYHALNPWVVDRRRHHNNNLQEIERVLDFGSQ